jgi:GDP-mannose 6-dehydrogenase
MLESLIGKGYDLRVYDPNVNLDSIYGSNRNFLLNAIPHIGRLLVPTAEAVFAWADQLVVTQKPGAALMQSIEVSGLPVLDVAGVLPRPARVRAVEHTTV